MYTYWIVDTQTGTRILKVNPSAGSWTRRLNGAGQGQHTFQLRSDGLSQTQHRALFAKWQRTLVVCWNDTPVYAGLITRTVYSRPTGALEVSHAEFRTILSRRFPFGIGTYATGTLVLNGRTLRGLVLQLVFVGTQGARSAVWDLPISFPIFDEAGTENRTYPNYLFRTIESAITELQDTENGPDIDFQPRWKFDGRLEWLLRVGSPAQPRLGGLGLEYNATASEPQTFDLTMTEDGAEMVTGVFAIGNGTEVDMKHGEGSNGAGSIAGGVPSLDVARQFKEIDDVGKLDAHARAEVATFQQPTVQWAFSTMAIEVFPNLVPGSPFRIYFRSDDWVEDGIKNMRAIGYSGDMTSMVSVDIQEA